MYFQQSNRLNLGFRNCLLLISVYSMVYAYFYLLMTVLIIINNANNVMLTMQSVIIIYGCANPTTLAGYLPSGWVTGSSRGETGTIPGWRWLKPTAVRARWRNVAILEYIIDYRIEQKMKSVGRMLSKLKALDIFASPVSLRYECKQKYKTRTGACISLGLLCFLLFNIYPFLTTLINYEGIDVTEFISIEENPTLVTIDKNNFFFAIGNYGVDMFSQTDRLFEYELVHLTVRDRVISKTLNINLVRCDEAVFKSTYSSFANIYEKMNLNQHLCLPENIFINISGKESSGNYEYLSFRVKGCRTNCASEQDLRNFEKLSTEYYIDFYLINKLLNPNMKNPISYYFEDKFFNIMSAKLLKKTDLFISQYVIKTEQSLFFPFSHEVVDDGFFININEREQRTLPVTNRTYLELNILKSDQKYNILRSYVTVGDLLSYVGGLFAIYALVFSCVVIQFNRLCFELKLYKKLFHEKTPDQSDANGNEKKLTFNFFTFIKYAISQLMFLICSPSAWSSMYSIKEKVEETQNKMNIDDFLQRIVCFQKNFKCLLNFEQIILLMLQEKRTISDERKQREFMDKDKEDISLGTHANIFKSSKITPDDLQNPKNLAPECKLKIFEAIKDLQSRMKNGNKAAERILGGVSKEIYSEYQKYEEQQYEYFKEEESGNESKSATQEYPAVIFKLPRNTLGLKKKSSFFT